MSSKWIESIDVDGSDRGHDPVLVDVEDGFVHLTTPGHETIRMRSKAACGLITALNLAVRMLPRPARTSR
jgi:hypothetical protein